MCIGRSPNKTHHLFRLVVHNYKKVFRLIACIVINVNQKEQTAVIKIAPAGQVLTLETRPESDLLNLALVIRMVWADDERLHRILHNLPGWRPGPNNATKNPPASGLLSH